MTIFLAAVVLQLAVLGLAGVVNAPPRSKPIAPARPSFVRWHTITAKEFAELP